MLCSDVEKGNTRGCAGTTLLRFEAVRLNYHLWVG